MSFFSSVKKLFGLGGEKKNAARELDAMLAFRGKVMASVRETAPEIMLQPDPENPLGIRVGDEAGGSAHADLSNPYKRLAAYSHEDEEEYVQTCTNMIIQAASAAADEMDVVRTQDIFPLIRSRAYIYGVRDQGAKIYEQPIVGDLHRIYMVDSPHALKALVEGDIDPIPDEELEALALENLRNAMMGLASEEFGDRSTLYYIEDNHFLTSGLILLEEFWSEVSREYGEAFIFAIPRVDQIFVFDAELPDALERAHQMIEVTFQDDFNLLSRQVFTHHDGVIRIVNYH